MRTKIIATIGPACSDYSTLKEMVKWGVRIFRLNFSHANAASFAPIIEIIRKIETDTDTPLTIMADLCGPKIRIGDIQGSPLRVRRHQKMYLGLSKHATKQTDHPFIPLDEKKLLKGLSSGQSIALSDGMLKFELKNVIVADELFLLQAENRGILTSKKGISFPGLYVPMAALTDKDKQDLKEGIDVGIDAVALSFVQSKSDLEELIQEMAKKDVRLPIIAKMERQCAVDDISPILDLSDAIMVARGDLGLECTLSILPVMQKQIIRTSRHSQKAAIVATQMLLSMVNNPVPTRAETTDVANAILDGADCVMLSEETAIGKYPVEAVKFIHDIAAPAEDYYLERTQGPYVPKKEKHPAKYLAYAACLIADNTESSALVCHSTSGATARLLSSRRPSQPVYALTPDPSVIKMMNFYWGVIPKRVSKDMPTHLERVQDFIQNYTKFKPGETFVITSGQPTPGEKRPITNEIKVYTK